MMQMARKGLVITSLIGAKQTSHLEGIVTAEGRLLHCRDGRHWSHTGKCDFTYHGTRPTLQCSLQSLWRQSPPTEKIQGTLLLESHVQLQVSLCQCFFTASYGLICIVHSAASSPVITQLLQCYTANYIHMCTLNTSTMSRVYYTSILWDRPIDTFGASRVHGNWCCMYKVQNELIQLQMYIYVQWPCLAQYTQNWYIREASTCVVGVVLVIQGSRPTLSNKRDRSCVTQCPQMQRLLLTLTSLLHLFWGRGEDEVHIVHARTHTRTHAHLHARTHTYLVVHSTVRGDHRHTMD